MKDTNFEERFEKQFKYGPFGGVMPQHRDGGVTLMRDLKKFILQERISAQEERQEELHDKVNEITKMIARGDIDYVGMLIELEKLFNLTKEK